MNAPRAYLFGCGVVALCVMLAGLALQSPAASPAPVPTPIAGNAQPIAQPTPVNPVQFVVTPGTVGSSAAQNSNFFKVYSDMNAIFSALNGCSYIPGPAIGTITVTSPLQVNLGTCSANTGTGVTAAFSLGVIPNALLPSAIVSTGLHQAAYVLSSANGSTPSVVPPYYISNGAAQGNTAHLISGTGSTAAGGTAVFNLAGAAAYGAVGSYIILVSISGGLTSTLTTDVTYNSATQFTVTISNAAGAGVAGINFNFVGLGV